MTEDDDIVTQLLDPADGIDGLTRSELQALLRRAALDVAAILLAEMSALIVLRAFVGGIQIPAPQLSIRSAKARDLAHRLARRENRSIADIIERALESYEVREAGREPAATFYARLAAEFGADLDLEVVIRNERRPHQGIDP
jgi:hypothetical protein